MKTHIYKRETISLHETSPVKCSRFYITIYIYMWDNETSTMATVFEKN